MPRFARLVVLGAILLAGACAREPLPGVQGAYRLSDGRLVSVRRSTDDTVRYRVFQTGETRRLHPEGNGVYVAGPGFSDREPVTVRVRFELEGTGPARTLTWKHGEEAPLTARRVNRRESVSFTSEGVRFTGRLDLPEGAGPHPAVVLVHGSGTDRATDYFYTGDFFAAHGIAALTYDKRGTGDSDGEPTFDFHLLARDAVAAVEAIQARPEIDPSRIGLSGYSQGGWVAPLAATIDDDVRFVLVSYGMIESPAEEARVETHQELIKRGVDEASLVGLDALTLAAVRIVDSGFSEGWEELAALKKETEGAPWRKKLSGTTVGAFVKYPRWLVKLIGPHKALPGLDWYYDSTEVLESLSIPMIWMLGDSDESAPNEATIEKLRRLAEGGKPFELVIFEGADHAMLLFDEVDGERVYTGYVPDYFRTEVAGARRLAGLDGGAGLQ